MAAGQRSKVTIYFNGGTLPGNSNRVYMQWTDETIGSPYREEASLFQRHQFLARRFEST